MYDRHPDPILNAIFERAPYQGVRPSDATWLFIGLDANYDPLVASLPIYPRLLEYHKDATSFWQRHGVHHPFLLPGYTGDGKLYHRSFSRIGLLPEDAGTVSFAEVLHVPTVGRSRLEVGDLDPRHIQWLSDAILHGRARCVFMPSGVASLLRDTGQFDWLSSRPSLTHEGLSILFQQPGKRVLRHLHFSVYGKFQRQKEVEASAIGRIVRG